MRQFGIVWKHEFLGYVKTKSFIGISLGFALLFAVLLSLPSFIDLSGLIPGLKRSEVSEGYQAGEEALAPLSGPAASVAVNGYEGTICLWDAEEIVGEEPVKQIFPAAQIRKVSSEEELTDLVEDSGESVCGFAVYSPTNYRYYVKNRSFSDSVGESFDELLGYLFRQSEFARIHADGSAVEAIYGTPMESETVVLGKDSVQNFLYTYLLIFVLYFMVLIYGASVAVSIAQEKSNRAMEVLVTSTSSNSLIFGKVLAGTAASFLQTGIIIGAALAAYRFNREAWNGMLDFVLQIPAPVLLTFAVFGVLGYILYAFCYGVLGALVSKTEDVSRTSGPLQFLFIISFLLTMFNLQNSDGVLMKVLSFIPFTSPNAMFARVAMGSVAVWEVALSLALLLGTILVTAVGGAKIYRMGTLMYGNPIKLSRALKMSREKNQ